jgi:hypothetical protein
MREKPPLSQVDPCDSRIAPLGRTQTFHQLKLLISKGKTGLCTKNASLYYYHYLLKERNQKKNKFRKVRRD